MTNFADNLKTATALLDAMYWTHDRPLVYVAYSGGRDSACVLDLAGRWGRDRGVTVRAMSIDTGLSCDGWADMVRDHCHDLNISLDVVVGKGYEWYRDNVASYGFGYTPVAHVYYYRALKQTAIQSHLQSVKRHYRDRVLYLTGVRRAESIKRSSAKWYIRHGSRVTVAPIVDWSNLDTTNYASTICSWWENPYYAIVGNSGDCQCGWTCKNTLSDLQMYPDLHQKIRSCQVVSLAGGHNRYGERMDDVSFNTGDNMPDDSLCINCHQPKLL